MKKILLALVAVAIFAACKKNKSNTPSDQYCEHCVQMVVDSSSESLIEIKDGGASTTYCDDVLDNVHAQQPVYFHNFKICQNGDTSRVQKYYWNCEQ